MLTYHPTSQVLAQDAYRTNSGVNHTDNDNDDDGTGNWTKKSPFKKVPDPNKATRFRRASSDIIYWVKPEHKCLIRYQDITNDGLLRHPSFREMVN